MHRINQDDYNDDDRRDAAEADRIYAAFKNGNRRFKRRR